MTPPRWCAGGVCVVEGCPNVGKPDPLEHDPPERHCPIGDLLKSHDVGLTGSQSGALLGQAG